MLKFVFKHPQVVEIQVRINYDLKEFGGPKIGRSLMVNFLFFFINVETTFQILFLKTDTTKKPNV